MIVADSHLYGVSGFGSYCKESGSHENSFFNTCKLELINSRLAGPQDSAMDHHRTNGRLGRATSSVPGMGGPRAEGAGELLLERTKTLQASLLHTSDSRDITALMMRYRHCPPTQSLQCRGQRGPYQNCM